MGTLRFKTHHLELINALTDFDFEGGEPIADDDEHLDSLRMKQEAARIGVFVCMFSHVQDDEDGFGFCDDGEVKIIQTVEPVKEGLHMKVPVCETHGRFFFYLAPGAWEVVGISG